MKEIEIKIDKKGNVIYKVRGVKGEKCVEYSKFIDEALGEPIERQYTEEYYEEESIDTTDKISEESY